MKTNPNVILPTNKYQTPVTKELKDSLSDEVYLELVDFLTSVPFVKNLISPDRQYAKDRPKMRDGKRIVVDIENPHILEDMEYFIQERRYYEKYGCYTKAPFNSNKDSDYRIFWDAVQYKCLHGMVRESDGEWISGYNYWYWNFGIILVTVATGEVDPRTGKSKSDRLPNFSHIWEADYLFFHYVDQGEESGTFGAVLKARGMGVSFKVANMSTRNYYHIKNSKSFFFATSDEYFYVDGVWTKVIDQESHLQATAFKKNKITSKEGHYVSGYMDMVSGSKMGYASEIAAVNTKDPQKTRGKRCKLAVHEEAGSNKHLKQSWKIMTKSLNDKGNVYGYQLAIGTGGDKESDFVGLSELFYQPLGYDIYALNNVFDKGDGSGKCAFFMGEYINYTNCYTADGVTDVVKALVIIFKNRETLRLALQDPDVLAQEVAEGALTPQEAILAKGRSDFPIQLIKSVIANLQTHYETETRNFLYGHYSIVGGKPSFSINNSDKPITEFPYYGQQQHLAPITIKEVPCAPDPVNIPWGRYIMGIDTLDDDGGEGSMFSWQIMDLWTDDIVAWYMGRKNIISDNHAEALAAAMAYNASIMYEANFKGFFQYCFNVNAVNYLADTPEILIDKGWNKAGYGNKAKGIRANARVNKWGRTLQADWMRKTHMHFKDKIGVETIKDIEYLREMGSFRPESGNYDKISSGNMLFIYREEMVKVTDFQVNNTSRRNRVDEQEDPFFSDTDLKGVSLDDDLSKLD